MAAIIFPQNPTINQEFTPAGSTVTYKWNGTYWQLATATIANSASFAASASFALTASYALNGGGGGTTNTGSFTGSFTGSVLGSASYALTASYALNTGITNTGSFTGSFTGSVLGTASYALNSLTSSFAITSSFNFVTQSTVFTASYVSGSSVDGAVLSSSYALTASYAMNGGGTGITNTGSFTGSFTGSVLGSASFAETASFASTAQTVLGSIQTASLAFTASFVTTAQTASFVNIARTASFVDTARTASWVSGNSVVGVVTSSISASLAASASLAVQSTRAQFSLISGIGATAGEYSLMFASTGATGYVPAYIETAGNMLRYNPSRDRLIVGSISVSNGFTGSLFGTAETASYVSSFVYPGEIHVSTGSGDDTTGNGSLFSPYQSLPKAFSVATTSSTIFVHPGTYTGIFTISGSHFSIVGYGAGGGNIANIGSLIFRNTTAGTTTVSDLNAAVISLQGTGSVRVNSCTVDGYSSYSSTAGNVVRNSILLTPSILQSPNTAGSVNFDSTTIGGANVGLGITGNSFGLYAFDNCRFTGAVNHAGDTGCIVTINNSLLSGNYSGSFRGTSILNNVILRAPNGTLANFFNIGIAATSSLTNVSWNETNATSRIQGLTNFRQHSFSNTLSATSFIGTASWASNAVNANFATTAQTVLGSIQTASLAFTASFVDTARTASYVLGANVAGNVPNATTAQTASRITGSGVIGIVSNAFTASYVEKSWMYAYRQGAATTWNTSAAGTITQTMFANAFRSGSTKITYNANSTFTFQAGTYEIYFTLGQVTLPTGFADSGWVSYRALFSANTADTTWASTAFVYGRTVESSSYNLQQSTGIVTLTGAAIFQVIANGNSINVRSGGGIARPYSGIGDGWRLQAKEL
jgi:hypothetical protein